MRATLNYTDLPARIFASAAAAESVAASMRSDDDDWSYVVVVDPKGSGRAIVTILDETGERVGSV